MNKGLLLKRALLQQQDESRIREAEVKYFKANYGEYFMKLDQVSDGMRVTDPQAVPL